MNGLVQYGVYETLTPQQQDVHRDFVAARWESILGHLFDKSESPAARALTIADGVEVLKHYSTDEINEAWRQERARQIAAYGRLKDRVVPETLTMLIHSARPKPVLVKTEPAEKPRGERVSPEAMAAIRDEFGFFGTSLCARIVFEAKANAKRSQNASKRTRGPKVGRGMGAGMKMGTIIRGVSNETGIKVCEMKGHKRFAMVVDARSEFVKRSRSFGFSLTQIGIFLGNRHHTTILNLERRG